MNAYIYIWERSLTQTHVRPFAHSQSLPLRVKPKQHKNISKEPYVNRNITHTQAHTSTHVSNDKGMESERQTCQASNANAFDFDPFKYLFELNFKCATNNNSVT